ncbi:uncharacterized protein [Centruroides vittatus]|uniref:uncharacterized protein n=1 Tax=Centruroides vittatus TaxID=120091 RepID=UPI00350ED60E
MAALSSLDLTDEVLGKIEVVVEIRSMLGSSNISLRLTECKTNVNKFSVTIKKTEIVFLIHNEQKYCLNLKIEDYEFVPSSCSGLSGFISSSGHFQSCILNNEREDTKPKGSGLEITFNIQVGRKKEPFVFTELNEELVALSSLSSDMNNFGKKLRRNVPYQLKCKTCLRQFFNSPTVFKNIYEMPSDNWEELSSDWFCHKRGNDLTESIRNYQLNLDDLILADSYYKLNVNIFSGILCDEKTKEISCERCYSRIGMLDKRTKHSKIITFFKVKAFFSEVYENENCHDDINDIELMKYFIKKHSNLTSTCKICFDVENTEFDDQSDTSLLIWAMDCKLSRFYTSFSIYSSSKENTIDILTKNVIRILYFITSRDSVEAWKWRQDFSVEVEKIDQSILWLFLKELVESTKTVPPSQRFVDQLMLGYLPV